MNNKKIGVFFLVFFCVTTLIAQEKIVIKKREFKKTDQTDGFKEAWKNLKEGDKYYSQGFGTFNLARDHYLFAQQYNGYNAELNYKIGVCYLFGDDKFKAIDFLLKAYELKPEVSHEVKLLIGKAYHQVLEFDKAIKFYMDYKDELPADENNISISDAVDKLIIECSSGKNLIQNPKRVIIQNLGEAVNSGYDEYNPRFAYEDTALFFTSRRPLNKKSKRNELDNKFFEDIYISSYSNGEFQTARPLEKPFNTKGNDAVVGIAPDGGSIFIYRGGENGGDIQRSFFRSKNGKWQKPESLSKSIGSDSRETTAALSPNGNELYFVSSNPDKTIGGKDIFVSARNAKGKWGEPRNLGVLINSRYDEEGIFLSSDGLTMYFASQGHNSMGGFDIFRSVKNEGELWSSPENLGYPVNTPEDEIFYITDAESVYGYYTSKRENGLGEFDIYKVISLGTEKEVSTLISEKLVAGVDYHRINPFLTLPEKRNIDTVLNLIGRVRDTLGGVDNSIVATLSFIDPDNGQIVARALTGEDGFYRARINEAKSYGVEINATGYLYFLNIIDLSNSTPDEPVELDFYLSRIEVGTKVVLENIYFETGKSVLTPDSYEALNQVARFLENNSSVRLEISGHTDNTGSLRINTSLSEARAKAVVDYVVGQGVERSRLEYKGYADTQPVAENSTAEGREMNRRVEFKVLSK